MEAERQTGEHDCSITVHQYALQLPLLPQPCVRCEHGVLMMCMIEIDNVPMCLQNLAAWAVAGDISVDGNDDSIQCCIVAQGFAAIWRTHSHDYLSCSAGGIAYYLWVKPERDELETRRVRVPGLALAHAPNYRKHTSYSVFGTKTLDPVLSRKSGSWHAIWAARLIPTQTILGRCQVRYLSRSQHDAAASVMELLPGTPEILH